MPSITIKDFKGGLDARKYKLSLPAGTLTKLVNGHITQGAEIEKRKQFCPDNIPSDTYGLQDAVDGIYVFGSRNVDPSSSASTVIINAVCTLAVANPVYPLVAGDLVTIAGSGVAGVNGVKVLLSGGNTPSFATPGQPNSFTGEAVTITPTFPAPIIYQRLTHPISGVTMTGVLSSTYFNGRTQVVTTWSNDDVLVFDKTDLEKDFYVGAECNITPTPFDVATSLAAQVNATGKYTATPPVLPAFLYIQITAGTSSPGVNVVGAYGMGYSFGRYVTLNVSGGGTYTSMDFALFNTPVDWHTSNDQTATDVMNAINSTNQYGFVASIGSSPNIVKVVPPATDGNGNSLAVAGSDSLSVFPGGNVQIYNPPIDTAFQVFSIPTITDSSPYTVASTGVNATANSKLISSGTAAILPLNAAGQFTLTAGMDNVHATGTLTYSAGIPANNQTVTVGGVVYTFVNFLTNLPNQVLIGASGAATFQNLVYAINAGTGLGQYFSSSTLVNPSASAGAIVGGVSTLTAIAAGVPGNSVALASAATGIAASGAALSGGTNVNYISGITVGGVQILSGSVPFNSSVNQTAADLVTNINGFQGTSGYSASANGAVITIKANVAGTGANQATIAITCVNGVCIANCTFAVSNLVPNSSTIGQITFNGSNIMASSPLTYQDAGHSTETGAQFMARVAATINAYTATGHAVAVASGLQVWVSNAVASSTDNSPAVSVNYLNCSVGTGATTALSATGNVSTVTFETNFGTSVYSVNKPSSAVVTAQGGTAPYSYQWQATGLGLNAQPQVTGKANQYWQISNTAAGHTFPHGTDTWTCIVKDAAGLTTSVSFYVTN